MAAQRIPAVLAAVQIMKNEGVDIVFGCPGAALLPLYAAMEEAGIERLSGRHEEGAAFMADGWARTTGRTGVVAVTAGPGSARLITGLYAAQQDAVPLVCVTGRETAGPRRRAGPPRHATGRPPDLVRLAGPVTKRAERIEDPARIPGAFREAFRIAREGRPGPVLIDLPADLAAAEIVHDTGRRPGCGGRPPRAGVVQGGTVQTGAVQGGTAQTGTAQAGSVRAEHVRPLGAASGPAGHADPDGSRSPVSWVLAEVAALFGAQDHPEAEPDAAPGIGPGTGPGSYLVSSSAGDGDAAFADTPYGQRHRLHRRSGPPGWEVPAAIGVRKALDSRGERDAEVVVVVDGHGFPFPAEELASAVRHEVPFVLILFNPGHEDHSRCGQHGPYEHLARYDQGRTDHVKLVEAYGCAGRDVLDPAELRSAVEWARKEAVSTRRPVLVEIRTACAERAAGGPPAGPVHEFAHGTFAHGT
ncbi:thiamine pyrophosphate-binding protein [Streptomyces sp. MCA2]|uniref:thiamine pyrophosphate-binding protein n=1 Tax=Streptomyces sp. MCA2 TaxID=2944805 RepID=UPI002021C652|nr:thiamine pyrophosphate-binding protein [Streptomyces sp. MCA2]MCL7493387.1 thiamine pyrophosphate-binding protein [Streptomyces sp. MCA2]